MLWLVGKMLNTFSSPPKASPAPPCPGTTGYGSCSLPPFPHLSKDFDTFLRCNMFFKHPLKLVFLLRHLLGQFSGFKKGK